MFKNECPIFIHKNILKIDMLEKIRDYPKDLFDIFYQDYSDGILTGCELEVQNHSLLLHPGIILYHQRIYYSKEDEIIPYSASGREVYLKIRFFDKEKEIEKINYLSQIILSTEEANQKDEIELCRFYLQNGAELRSEYQSFEDFSTKYNTINRINVPYAGRKKSTVWSYLLEYFAKEIMKRKEPEPIDLVFSMNILHDANTVSRDMITAYIEKKTKKEAKDFSNYEIYLELLRLLKSSPYEERMEESKLKRKPYKIIVD